MAQKTTVYIKHFENKIQLFLYSYYLLFTEAVFFQIKQTNQRLLM